MEDSLQEKANLRFTSDASTIVYGPGPRGVEFYDTRPKNVQELEMKQFETLLYLKDFKNQVELLVATFPNDQELGAALRQFVKQ